MTEFSLHSFYQGMLAGFTSVSVTMIVGLFFILMAELSILSYNDVDIILNVMTGIASVIIVFIIVLIIIGDEVLDK